MFHHGPFQILFLLNANHFTAFIVTAVWAYAVGQTHLTAIAALHQIAGFQGVMGSPSIAATFGQLPFWQWGHISIL